MVKRSTVLKFYDRVHINSVRLCWLVALAGASVTFYRICEILFIPIKPQRMEDNPDFKKLVQQNLNARPN